MTGTYVGDYNIFDFSNSGKVYIHENGTVLEGTYRFDNEKLIVDAYGRTLVFDVGDDLITTENKTFKKKTSPTPSQAVANAPSPSAPEHANPQAAQRRAIQLYPDLGIANSPLNREFVKRYQTYKTTNPHYLDDPDWPTHLAKESKDAMTPK